MKLISAADAMKITEGNFDNDIEKIMSEIENEAIKGRKVLHVYRNLSEDVCNKLKELGYDMPPIPNICLQRDGLFHSIHW